LYNDIQLPVAGRPVQLMVISTTLALRHPTRKRPLQPSLDTAWYSPGTGHDVTDVAVLSAENHANLTGSQYGSEIQLQSVKSTANILSFMGQFYKKTSNDE
jgi:hypothetical protein